MGEAPREGGGERSAPSVRSRSKRAEVASEDAGGRWEVFLSLERTKMVPDSLEVGRWRAADRIIGSVAPCRGLKMA